MLVLIFISFRAEIIASLQAEERERQWHYSQVFTYLMIMMISYNDYVVTPD